ncbi:MAG: hypothetical protein MJK04_01365 [Psychrosphaera sp.]|nr:hypothetical protein [Psychrosphaera sp.]
MNNTVKTVLESNVIAIIIGALLTFWFGGVIANKWAIDREKQSRAFELRNNIYNERIKFLETFSTIAQKRLFLMKQVYWTTKKVTDVPHYKNYDERWHAYRPSKNVWNENLFNNYSRAAVLFDEKTEARIKMLHKKMHYAHNHLSVIRLKKGKQFIEYRKKIVTKLDDAIADLQLLIKDLYNRSLKEK